MPVRYGLRKGKSVDDNKLGSYSKALGGQRVIPAADDDGSFHPMVGFPVAARLVFCVFCVSIIE